MANTIEKVQDRQLKRFVVLPDAQRAVSSNPLRILYDIPWVEAVMVSKSQILFV